MSKGRILVAILLVIASLGAYFPPVKSEQPWLSGRETFIYQDNIITYCSFISENYFVYTIHHKNSDHQADTYSIHSLDLATGETYTIQENDQVLIPSVDVFKISGDYFVWAIGKHSYIGDLYCINLKTKVKKKIEGITRQLSHVSLNGSLVVTKSRDSDGQVTSIYVFDINKDEVARKVVDLKAETKFFYSGKNVITFEFGIFRIFDLTNLESKEIALENKFVDLPKRLINYSNGYLLYLTEFNNVFCYNFNNNTKIPLYMLEKDERLWTEYNQNSSLIMLTRAFTRQKGNPAYISHKQYMVFDTKTEKLYEITPLFEMSEYCLARNNSSYENKLVFLHYEKGEKSEKTNCVIEYMEFPDSKDEEPKKYYVADSKKRPCNLRSYPMICNGKITYIEESLREEDNKEKIVIFSYEQKVERTKECKLIQSKDFYGSASLGGAFSNQSLVTYKSVNCSLVGICGDNTKTYLFDTGNNKNDKIYFWDSAVNNYPTKSQQIISSIGFLLNKNGTAFCKYYSDNIKTIRFDSKNLITYAINDKYVCFCSTNEGIFLSNIKNPDKLDKILEFDFDSVEKMYLKGYYLFLQVCKKIPNDPIDYKLFIVYDIPKKTKYIVENSEHQILDGGLRGDSLYYVVNMGSPGYRFNRHRLIKQKIGQDFQETLLQLYGYETLKIIDNPYTDTLCIQRDLTIGDGVSAPVYESSLFILDPLENSMIEAYQSHSINDFSVLSYFGKTVAVIMEDENSFWAKLLTPNLGGDITEQEIPFVTSNSGFVNAQLTDRFLYVVTTDFVKREASYMAYSCK